jgi:SAM-dependent methyltransferase
MINSQPLPAGLFTKIDELDDTLFYEQPRLVHHIDEGAVAALTAFYGEHLPCTGRILDLMSSWVSHFPVTVTGDVVGHGMNAVELRANRRLQDWFVQNLNVQPALRFGDAHFDAVTCCVGVQYLQQPDAVFADLARVLQPNAPCIVSFSNRCFPTKAVAVWRRLGGRERANLVGLCLQRAGFDCVTAHVLRDGGAGDPLTAVVGYAPQQRS